MTDNFNQNYRLLNKSFSKKLVYRIGNRAGFYSEYNNMIYTMLYCIRKEIQFELYSQNSNFSIKGWNDFFVPFCNENKQKWHQKFNHSWILPKPKTFRNVIVTLYYTFLCYINNVDYLTSDLFYVSRNQRIDESFLINNLSNRINFLQYCNLLVQMTYKFNHKTKQEVEQYLKAFNFNEYVGFHIRRGDKSIEKAYNKLEDYIKKAEGLTKIRKAFVSTDDYLVVQELIEKFQNWEFYSIVDDRERGYNYIHYYELGEIEKRNHLIGLFASIEMLVNANLFIGTFSSNIGSFVYMRRNGKNVYAVDYDNWVIW
jgi:hypothetical protein